MEGDPKTPQEKPAKPNPNPKPTAPPPSPAPTPPPSAPVPAKNAPAPAAPLPVENPDKAKRNRAKSTVFNDDVKRIPMFTCDQLVDLALCAPEVGAVNFNILRMLLRDLVYKTGVVGVPASLSELEARQADNFKRYLEGMNVASPMPGVLRIGQQGHPPPPPPQQYYGPQPPPPPGGQPGMQPGTGTQTQQGPRGRPLPPHGPRSPRGGPGPGEPVLAVTKKTFSSTAIAPLLSTEPPEPQGDIDELVDKVHRLEQQLGMLNELPSNKELLEEARTGTGKSISVGEMWQIIQLNNRQAAAEAAIQKMATLIEDLAKNVGKMKADAKSMAKGNQDLAITNSDLQLQGQELVEKYGHVDNVLDSMQKEMAEIKQGWKQDRDNLQKVLGVDLGNIPSFMKERPPMLFKRGSPKPPDDRSTQTLEEKRTKRKTRDQYVTAEEIAGMSAGEILDSVTPEELNKMTPAVYKQLNPDQKKALSNLRRSIKLEGTKKPLGVAKMTDEELAALNPREIYDKMPYEEAMSLPQEILAKMTDDQKEMLRKVIQRGPGKKITSRRDLKLKKQKDEEARRERLKEKPPLGIVSMTQAQLLDLTSQEIAQKMGYDEAKSIPPSVLSKMRKSQQEAIQAILDAGAPEGYREKPGTKPMLGIASMSKAELAQLTLKDIQGMSFEEAKNLPQEVLQNLPPELQAAILKIIQGGPPASPLSDEYDDDYDSEAHSKRKTMLTKDEIDMITDLAPHEIAENLTPEQAALIPEDEMEKRFTAAQIDKIERWKDEFQLRKSTKKSLSPAEILVQMSEEYTEEMFDEEEEEFEYEEEEEEYEHEIEHEHLHPTSGEEEEHEHDEHEPDLYDHEELDDGKKKKSKAARHHKNIRDRKRKKRRTRKGEPVEEEEKPTEPAQDQPPPISLDQYLQSLDPEEAANLAADAVQKEMEKQYQQLQGLQRQMAMDIQEKMEFIYQKLIKEIAAQQMTSSPYGHIAGAEACFGPGVCPGHDLPAGVAVCEISDGTDAANRKALLAEAAKLEASHCPGPGPCPGPEICPYCKADKSAKEALKALEEKKGEGEVKPTTPGGGGGGGEQGATQKETDMETDVLDDMRNLMLLDLEKLRREMRTVKFSAYDEQDILERLAAVWEALKILKNNEETLALKVAKQDNLIKRIPAKTMEKLYKIPDENLDALIQGDLGKLGVGYEDRRATFARAGHEPLVRGTLAAGRSMSRLPGSIAPVTGIQGDDIQTLFDNLANVIAECAQQRDMIDQIADTARIIESAMVTKQMLTDAMSDKADKGLINTKVSYDEFGSTVDELNNQLQNLMLEGFQRNENFKQVTTEMSAELAEKLDRVELAPLRAFFKSHLQGLEDQVMEIVRVMQEPDPAGTRKKVLKDYNCLSCDRTVNISGMTNTTTLPTIGPVLAGHPRASKIALGVSQQRMQKKKDQVNKNIKAMERRRSQSQASRLGMRDRTREGPYTSEQMQNDMDVMHVVNRYTGGSHTGITTADVTAAARRSQAIDPAYLASQSVARGNPVRRSQTALNRPPTSHTGDPVSVQRIATRSQSRHSIQTVLPPPPTAET